MSEPLAGKIIDVGTPTHVAGLLEFEAGPLVSLVTSFDVKAHGMPCMEIYGSEGTLSLPDPNTFGGPVRVRRHKDSDWSEVPLAFGYADNSRGVGLSDMIAAIEGDREHRANARTAYHVLDIMHGILDSAGTGRHIEIASSMTRPLSMPAGLADGEVG